MIKSLIGEGMADGGGYEDFEATFGSLDPARQGYDSPLRMVNYIESHDEGRLILELVKAGMDRETARKKSALGASVLLMLPGPVMLYQGEEWGEDTVRTQEYNPLHREFLETQAGKELFDHYSRMIRIRRENQAVRTGNFKIEAVYAEKKTGIFHRWNDGGNEIVAVYNFAHDEQSFTVPFPRSGVWKDLLSGRGVQIEDELEMMLGGSDAAIFVNE